MIIREERIGNQRLILGDCLSVMPTLGRFDAALLALPFQPPQAGMVGFPEGWAILTDPPYGIGRDGKKRCTRHAGYEAKGWDAFRPEAALRMIAEADCPRIIWGGGLLRRHSAEGRQVAGVGQEPADRPI